MENRMLNDLIFMLVLVGLPVMGTLFVNFLIWRRHWIEQNEREFERNLEARRDIFRRINELRPK